MIIKLTEIAKDKNYNVSNLEENFVLREVFINPEHVVCLREDNVYKRLLSEGKLMSGLNVEQCFTRVYLNRGQAGIEMTVVGSPSSVQEKIGSNDKQLLRG